MLTGCAQAEPAAAPTSAESAPRKKRGPAPPLPAAVVAAGVAYAAVADGTSRGLDQPTGYIAATDAASGRELWTLKVFATRTGPAMEADKQGLHIAKLALADGRRAVLVPMSAVAATGSISQHGRSSACPEALTLCAPPRNAPGMNTASTRRILGASLVGTAVEFYDFYIYATAASLVFGPLFFPSENASAQLLAAYASFAVAFVARPIGAVVFGHYGDRIGRKSTLVASLLVMGGSTLAIAFLPTYASAGWFAPLLLCTLRFGQGFGLGGEWGGAALLAVENAPPGWRGRFGMFPQLGAPVGFIAANGLFLILGLTLSDGDFKAWGWRLPFLFSAVLVGVGLWVRLKLTETPVFAALAEKGPPPAVPIAELFRDHWRATLGGTLGVIACFALFYLSTAFALGFGTTKLGYARETFLSVQLGAILFLGLGILLSGWLSDVFDPRRVLISGCIGGIGAGLALAPMLGSGSLPVVGAFLALALFTMGFVYGPLGAWLPGLFPARVRYTGASMSFNMGGILGGGLAPIVAQALSDRGGLQPVGWYLAAACTASLGALLLLKRPPHLD